MTWTTQETEQAFVEVRKRAITDKTFRNFLLKSPNQAIQQVTGKPVPAGVKITIIEADPTSTLTFVLPAMPAEELSAEDLEKVAGGGTCIGDVCANVCAGNVEKG